MDSNLYRGGGSNDNVTFSPNSACTWGSYFCSKELPLRRASGRRSRVPLIGCTPLVAPHGVASGANVLKLGANVLKLGASGLL